MTRVTGTPTAGPPRAEAAAAATVVSAPGRVNLIGDHTDYHGGLVLPMAVDRRCTVRWAPNDGDRVRVRSEGMEGRVDLAADGSDDPRAVEPSWGRFPAGVLRALADRGREPTGFDAGVTSDVPVGSGLSSSSALSVSFTLAAAEAGGLPIGTVEAARAALKAEVLATGVPGGLMDQLTALWGVAGHALLIDCRALDARAVPVPDRLAVLVAHCGVPRTLAGSGYAERRAAGEAAARSLGLASLRDATAEQVAHDPIARHVVAENARVAAFADALPSGEPGVLGRLMLESHASLRDDYRVSIPELDALVDAFVAAGAAGARLTGAGFGGCVVALAGADTGGEVLERAMDQYRATTGREPRGFVARPVDGARPLAVRSPGPPA